jgi:hypothetical protein
MADNRPMENDEQRRARLFNELLENIEKQVAIDLKLKEDMEYLFNMNKKSLISEVMRDRIDTIRELYIEAESLQAEGRAVFHQLFGTHFED